MSRPLLTGLLALIGLAGLLAPPAAANSSLPVRPAQPADDAVLSLPGWTEEWRVLAFDPSTRAFAAVTFVGGPVPMISVSARAGGQTISGDAELPHGLLPHEGPGVTIANLPDDAPPQSNSISYSSGRYVVDLSFPAQGHLTIVPRRVGVTVGPWRLGREPVFGPGGTSYVPGRMSWSVPVAAGTVSGWIEADGRRITIDGWRAYHDHTWGRFRRSSTSWAHWDFAVVSPRPGEASILNGLEPSWDIYPHDDRWQGVLVHAGPSGIETCLARITRRGWEQAYVNILGSGANYWAPTYVRAQCGTTKIAAQAPHPWLLGGFSGSIRGTSLLPGGNGYIEHAVPVIPNT